MGKLILCFGVIVFLVLVSFIMVPAAEVAWEEIGGGHLNVSAVLVDPKKPQNIYMGSDQGIFLSSDSGKNWRYLFSTKGENRTINSLVYAFPGNDSLYAVTANGLFYSPDKSVSWSRIFHGKNSSEANCAELVVYKNYIYLGTNGGLFVSPDSGRKWERQTGELGYSKVIALAGNLKTGTPVYAACVEGVFKTENNALSWNKIYSSQAEESSGEEEETEDDRDENELFSVVRHIAIDPQNPRRVFLATSSGIKQSFDCGNSWESFSDLGLRTKEVKFLFLDPGSRLCAVTKSGVYIFEQDKWRDLSNRLVSGKINDLALDSSGSLLIASSKGLFRSQKEVLREITDRENNGRSGSQDDGPGIAAIQREAMRFAEVEPEKIMQWRKLAAKKAWLPQMSLGLNRDTADLWHWESGSTVKECDDELRRGRDSLGWDIRLSWELGDIVWSNDQTSIDVRSRLNAQMRNDILDEVTKIYFERLRVKGELADLDILEKSKRRNKELRILELNAYLDALTGGYFSRSISNGIS